MEPQNSDGSATRPPAWMAPVFVAIGLIIVAIACDAIHIDPRALEAPRWVLACTGGLFSLVGLLIAAQGNPTSLWAKLLAACFFSMFAAVFGWVGFGPGPRAFSTTMVTVFVTSHERSGEHSGRFVFGTVAVIVGSVAVIAWWRLGRSLIGASRRDDSAAIPPRG